MPYDELYSRLDMPEKRISQLGDISTEISKTEKQSKNMTEKKLEQIIQKLWETTKGATET